MKRAKLPTCAGLPFDVVVKIAFAIPDIEDLFSFLDALRPAKVLGPLESLYRLGLSEKRRDLWPSLRLDSSIRQSPRCCLYEDIAKYYPKVVVEEALDAEWLIKLDVAKIEWITEEKWPLVGNWSVLPIVAFSWLSGCEEPPSWNDIFAKMQHLTALKVGAMKSEAISDVCAFAAQSETLVHLELDCCIAAVPSNAQNNLKKWLDRHPGRQFGCYGVESIRSYDNTLKLSLYDTIFAHPNLETLILSNCNLYGVDLNRTNTSIKSLSVHECIMPEDFVIRLASWLEGSKLTHFSLTKYSHYDHKCISIQHLLEGVARSSVKHLELRDQDVDSKHLSNCFPLVETCLLESLTMYVPKFTKAAVKKLTTAIQNSNTLCELDLDESGISIVDIGLLIQAITHSSRVVKLNRVKWKPVKKVKDTTAVEALKRQAFEHGGEFVVIQNDE
ncbi:hypothetical protein LEN26_009962 [Aphanomyces euteiches]|nr:hypothetical protein LEN26_009962 [Aphanomyces euteiches]